MATTFAALLMFIAGLCGALPTAKDPVKRAPTVELVYQFPQTMSPENEFLRYNGQLLVTCLTCNTLSQLDPNLGPDQTRRTVYQFPDGVVNVLGIDQLSPDVFAVAVGQANITDPTQLEDPSSIPLNGPTGVWVVDLREYQAPEYDNSKVKAHKVGGDNLGGLFDGLAVINGQRGLVATTDFVEGNIWLVDIPNSRTTIIVQDLTLPSSNGMPSSLSLANGLKYHGGRLYFTGTDTGTYGYVNVNPLTGIPIGAPVVVYDYGFALDDFNFGPTGNVYFTTFAKPNGGIIKRNTGTPNGQSGSQQVLDYFATNSVIARPTVDGNCQLIMTVFLQFQVIRATLPGPC